MTILAAACRLVDEIVDSGSFARTEVSACDFGIMGLAPTCAITIRPSNSSFSRVGYGGVGEQRWGFSVRGWVKDAGDVKKLLTDVYHMHDAMYSSINGGSIANTDIYTTWVETIGHNQDNIWNFGGPDYQLVEAHVVVREDP